MSDCDFQDNDNDLGMSDYDYQDNDLVCDIQEDENSLGAFQDPGEGLTTDGPPLYSEVMSPTWTANDPGRSKAPPYQPSDSPLDLDLQHEMEQFRTAYNYSINTQTTPSQPPGPIAVTGVAINRLETGGQTQRSRTANREMRNIVIVMIVLFFVGTPLSLFLTIPTLWCACKVDLL